MKKFLAVPNLSMRDSLQVPPNQSFEEDETRYQKNVHVKHMTGFDTVDHMGRNTTCLLFKEFSVK
jgi:hypothetical protein